jgi:UDP-N-acetylmuramoylalanine--D-glutamate ligase
VSALPESGPVAWAGTRVVVAGIGAAGFAAADALLERGAEVVVVDGRGGRAESDREAILTTLGARVRLGEGAASALPDVDGAPADLVVASPGWRPGQPLLAAAVCAGVPIWGEAELAWRMRPATGAAPWLTLTGANGKTTTVRMLAAMLTAAGRRATAAGSVGIPLLEVVRHPDPYDVVAVALSGAQLRWSSSLRPLAGACLNVALPHAERSGSLRDPLRGYRQVYENAEVACVYNVADPVTEQLVRDADVVQGCRAVGFTLGIPAMSMLGVVEDVLCDRAFVEQRRTSAAELGTLDDVRTATGGLLAPHAVADALAAAALARAYGVPAAAVRAGLRGFTPAPHRIARIAERAGVTWVDDSAATNPHAVDGALAAFGPVVWVAGGVGSAAAGGAGLDDLVARHAARLRAVVLIGRDQDDIRKALQRHAPRVPAVRVDVTETGVVAGEDVRPAGGRALMDAVVARAARLAQPGDTVLLAPACAATDQFESIGDRGDAFAAAVRRYLGPDADPGTAEG